MIDSPKKDYPLPAEMFELDPSSPRDQAAAVAIAERFDRLRPSDSGLYATILEQVRQLGSVGPFCVCLATGVERLDEPRLAFLHLCRTLGEHAKRELAAAN